ncbi:MAG TPA: sigma 54-interacting transcriptional regulator [Candidatus Anammoximicrobium sp.]|nr:sigma 54-interacting transcriptional regulator [Candidatus Anammoximicrobium sp.]
MVSTHESLLHALMLDSISDGFIAVDEWGRITFLNRAAERLTLWQRGEVAGKVCEEVLGFIADDDACLLEETCQSVRGTEQQPVCLRDRNGRRLAVTVTTTILRWPDGRLAGSLATVRPLTKVQPAADPASANGALADIIGRSPAMENLFHLVPQFAHSSSTILIDGASGTGKELFARAIHNLSPRRDRSFVAVNCGALPDTLLESELFGYKAGAFTDARQDKPGRFALADGGTIFLDEIGDVSPAMQIKLLRVLQERVFEPLGSVESVKVDVRVIAATNRDLGDLVRRGAFREDLYYRINIVRLQLPALRERREDIPLLIEHLIGKFNRLQGKCVTEVSDDVLAILMAYDFPGNIRELENILEYAFVLCRGGRIEPEHLPPTLREKPPLTGKRLRDGLTLRDLETLHIRDALRRCRGNRAAAARELGINPSTLFRKLKSLRIPLTEGDGRSRKPR